MTEYTWVAGPIDSTPMDNSAFHFSLQKSSDSDCDGCSLNSGSFDVRQKQKANTQTSSTSSSSLSTSTSSPSPGSTSQGNSPAADAAARRGGMANNGGSDGGTGLAVGLAVGLPLLIILCGLIALYLFRRKGRKSQEPKREKHRSLTPDPSQLMTWSEEAEMMQPQRGKRHFRTMGTADSSSRGIC